MSWGFDFDFGSLVDSVGASISSAAEWAADNISLADAATIASVGGSLYLQNKTVEAQLDAIDSASSTLASSTDDLVTVDTDDNSNVTLKTVNVGDDDSVDENEDSNRGDIALDEPVTDNASNKLSLSGSVKSNTTGYRI